MKFIKHIKNRKGNALLSALVSTVAVTILGYTIAALNDASETRIKTTRKKTTMALLEYKIRTLATHPSSYTGCDSSIGISSCSFNMDVLNPIALVYVPGVKCDSGGQDCGIEIDTSATSFNTATNPPTFTTTIIDTDTEFPLRSVTFTQEIPVEMLQSQSFNCPAASPIFGGFVNGKPVCRSLPSCGSNQYIKAINKDNLSLTCSTISSASEACNNNKFISSFTWSGENSVSVSCANRVNPYTVTDWWNP